MSEELKKLDADGVVITAGAVLRSIEDGTRGVVVRFINPGDKHGPMGGVVGDCLIQLRQGVIRVTNRYSKWGRVPKAEQTFHERWLAWLYSLDDCKHALHWRVGLSADTNQAIEGVMALLPDDVVDWDYGPPLDSLENVLRILSDYLQEGQVERDQLNAWKEAIMAVEEKWNEQAVGMMLGIMPGQDIRSNIEPKVRELQAQVLALRGALEWFARREVPKKAIGNVGLYSIPFERITKAQDALSAPSPPVVAKDRHDMALALLERCRNAANGMRHELYEDLQALLNGGTVEVVSREEHERVETELAATQAQIAEVLNLAKKWRKKFQFDAAEEVEKIFKANPPTVVSREEHNRALEWINAAANLLPSLASMSSGQEREVQVLMGRHLVDEARILAAHEARKGGRQA